MARDKIRDVRRRVYALLDQGPGGSRAGFIIDRLLIGLILINVVAVALESVPALAREDHVLFVTVEYTSLRLGREVVSRKGDIVTEEIE